MKAIHFGAGNIGRGFIGKLLADAQAELTFADVNQPLVDQLAHQQSYQVNVVGENARVEQVNRVSAIHSNSADAIQQIAQADIITTAVGQHQMWTAQAYPLNRPRQWLTSGGLGTMGFGLPAAVGAALANPDKKVLCFSGDGSLMMNIQEMATAAENQLDVKIILMNNEALGLVHQQQSLFYKQGVFAATYPGTINFMQIAAGFGLESCDLNNEADPQAALQAIINRPGPALIHVRIDAQQKVYPMVPPGAANTEMVGE